MSEERPDALPAAADDLGARLSALDQKLDTVAGATAAVAQSQTELLARLAEAELRRNDDAIDVAQRLDALERQVLGLARSTEATPGDGAGSGSTGGLDELGARVAELAESAAKQRDDLTLALDVLARIAEAQDRADTRTDDRIAAVRDAAAVPVADLRMLLEARADRSDAQLRELATSLESAIADLQAATPAADHGGAGADPRLGAMAERVTEQVQELGEVVRGLSWQLPEITEELAGVRDRVEGFDVSGPLRATAEELEERVNEHTDTALVGVLRLIDDRLGALRRSLSELAPAPAAAAGSMGFEAGAVMGAAQAAWNRLEQRIDAEFDDLGRQLHALGALVEQSLATTEAVANRPVVTGEQLRRTAASMKDAVLNASRSRRDRRGGPRGLGPGSS